MNYRVENIANEDIQTYDDLIERMDVSNVAAIFDETDTCTEDSINAKTLSDCVDLTILATRSDKDLAIIAACTTIALQKAAKPSRFRMDYSRVFNEILADKTYGNVALHKILLTHVYVQKLMAPLLGKIADGSAERDDVLSYFSLRVVQASLSSVAEALRGETAIVKIDDHKEIEFDPDDLGQATRDAFIIYLKAIKAPTDIKLLDQAISLSRRLEDECHARRLADFTTGSKPGMMPALILLGQFHSDCHNLLLLMREEGSCDSDVCTTAAALMHTSHDAITELKGILQAASENMPQPTAITDAYCEGEEREPFELEGLEGGQSGTESPDAPDSIATSRSATHLRIVRTD